MKTVILSSFECKNCSLSNDRRKSKVSLTRKNWLHVSTSCIRCKAKNLAVIIG